MPRPTLPKVFLWFTRFGQRRVNPSTAVLGMVVALYTCLIMLWPGPGLHPGELATESILRGEFLDLHWIDPIRGRFSPFNGQEFNLLVVLGRHPLLLNGMMAVQFLIFTVFFFQIMQMTRDRRLLNIGLVLMVLIGAGSSEVWLRPLMAERNLVLYFAIFIFCLYRAWEKPTFSATLLCIGFCNAALYSKEIAVVGTIGFVIPAIFVAIAQHRKHTYPLLIGILLSVVVFFCIYYLVIIRGPDFGTGLYYRVPMQGFHWQGSALAIPLQLAGSTLIKLLTYSLEHPILIVFFLPIYLYHSVRVVCRRSSPALMDALGTAAFAIIVFFLLYGTTTSYYIYPAYVFALPYVANLLPLSWYKTRVGVTAAAILVFAFGFQALPLAAHQTTFVKYASRNLNQTTAFLLTELTGHPSKQGVELYIVGDHGHDLQRGLTAQLENHRPAPHNTLAPVTVSVLESNTQLATLNRGSYVLVAPDALPTKMDLEWLIFAAGPEYELLMRTHSRLALPPLTIKEKAKGWLSHSDLRSVVSRSQTYSWPDFAILRKSLKNPSSPVPD